MEKNNEGKKIRTCSFCVMNDESDSLITFDEKGQCNYCRQY